MNDKVYGFGFNPKERKSHFYVVVPKGKEGDVLIYERYDWNEGEQDLDSVGTSVLKHKIRKSMWQQIVVDLTRVLNKSLKEDGKPTAKFIIGETAVEMQLGKELMLLLWGVEDVDENLLFKAFCNWRGLSQEERWWLYTMTNAATGNINDKKGWRTAVKYILCENPVF